MQAPLILRAPPRPQQDRKRDRLRFHVSACRPRTHAAVYRSHGSARPHLRAATLRRPSETLSATSSAGAGAVLHAARVPRRECPWGRGHIEDKIPREVTEVEAAAYKARMQNAETGASCVVAARPTQRRACAGDTATACAGIKLGVHGIIHKHADSFTGAEMVTWCVHTPRVRAPSCPIAGGANVRTCVYRLVQADKLMHRSRAVRLGEALLARGAAGSSAARSAS